MALHVLHAGPFLNFTDVPVKISVDFSYRFKRPGTNAEVLEVLLLSAYYMPSNFLDLLKKIFKYFFIYLDVLRTLNNLILLVLEVSLEFSKNL